jgi:DNA-binding MarR family transcriptional regulator
MGRSERNGSTGTDAVIDPIAEARRQWVDHGLAEPLAMAAATSIIRAQQLVNAAVDRALRPHGLTFARYEVLMLLSFSRTGALPMTKVGERLMVHPTGITKLVDKLEQEGLVRREPNPTDRRGTLARITPAGRHRAARASSDVSEVRFGADLTDDDLEQLVELLRKLRAGAGDLSV